jgi:hypothetical protein
MEILENKPRTLPEADEVEFRSESYLSPNAPVVDSFLPEAGRVSEIRLRVFTAVRDIASSLAACRRAGSGVQVLPGYMRNTHS